MNLSVMFGTAVWLGLLTSISPCPLATNLAASAYLARRVDSRRRAVMGVVAYTMGRVATYAAIAGLLELGVASAPAVSFNLQRWMTPLLGPALVLAAMVLLGLIALPFQTSLATQSRAEKLAACGLLGELALGFLFALSFCPVSAALFFGSLVPLAIGGGWIFAPVIVYGIGTAAPVAGFALLMVFSVRAASRLAGGIGRLQPWFLKATGGLLLVAGFYLTARDTLGLLP
jgi:cytochrome c biogenesis protein CcdA